MLFYNAGPCYPGGLVDSVTDSGGGVQGSYPNIDTSPPPVNKFCFSIARGLSRVKMLVTGENVYGILFPLRERRLTLTAADNDPPPFPLPLLFASHTLHRTSVHTVCRWYKD